MSDVLFVSAIIPLYNAMPYFREAIESVRNQTRAPDELIVIDDGSTDGSGLIAREDPGIIYIRQRNQGPSSARNTGIKAARGNVIAFLDADDLWPKNKLEIQVQYLVENPSVDIVLGHIQLLKMKKEENVIKFQEYLSPRTGPLIGCAIQKKETFLKAGNFDENLPDSEDLDWFLRAKDNGLCLKTIEPVTLFYRLHDTNMTHNKTIHDFKIPQVIKQSLDRRKNLKKIDPKI